MVWFARSLRGRYSGKSIVMRLLTVQRVGAERPDAIGPCERTGLLVDELLDRRLRGIGGRCTRFRRCRTHVAWDSGRAGWRVSGPHQRAIRAFTYLRKIRVAHMAATQMTSQNKSWPKKYTTLP